MNEIKKEYWYAGAVVLGLIIIALFVFSDALGLKGVLPERKVVVASVNGEEITEMQVEARRRQLVVAGTGALIPHDALFTTALDELINETILYQDALARGIVSDEAFVLERYNFSRDAFDSEAEFQARLEVNFLTNDQFIENLRRQFILISYFKLLAREEVLGISDATVDTTDESGVALRVDIETNLTQEAVNGLSRKRLDELKDTTDIQIFLE